MQAFGEGIYKMKDDVRNVLKIKRKYFINVRREVADCNILDNFVEAYSKYESFFVYNSFGSEAGTDKIIDYLLGAGKKVYLPRVEGDNIVAAPYGKTRSGAFGIEEPCGQAFTGDADVTVIPLLAVNGRGYRIGYGKGYYDRYLKDRHTLKVGLGYHFQIADFKEDAWDVPLDEFICEKGIYRYGID